MRLFPAPFGQKLRAFKSARLGLLWPVDNNRRAKILIFNCIEIFRPLFFFLSRIISLGMLSEDVPKSMFCNFDFTKDCLVVNIFIQLFMSHITK